MIKWFELRNTPPFILNKKHPPSGLRGIFRLWPGGPILLRSAMELQMRVSCSMCIRRIWASQKTLHISVLPWSWRTLLVPRWSPKNGGPTLWPWFYVSAGWYMYIYIIYIYRDSILEVFPDPVTTTLQGWCLFCQYCQKPLCWFFFLLGSNLIHGEFEFSIQMLPSTPRKLQLR